MSKQDAVLRFTVPLPPVALRRNRMTRNVNYRAKLVREYQEEVWCAGHEAMPIRRIYVVPGFRRPVRHPISPWPRAHVSYVWRSTHPTDEDNIVASCKPILDVLKATGPRPLGIIEDDGPGVTVSATWQKVKTKAEECVVVEITALSTLEEALR